MPSKYFNSTPVASIFFVLCYWSSVDNRFLMLFLFIVEILFTVSYFTSPMKWRHFYMHHFIWVFHFLSFASFTACILLCHCPTIRENTSWEMAEQLYFSSIINITTWFEKYFRSIKLKKKKNNLSSQWQIFRVIIFVFLYLIRLFAHFE